MAGGRPVVLLLLRVLLVAGLLGCGFCVWCPSAWIVVLWLANGLAVVWMSCRLLGVWHTIFGLLLVGCLVSVWWLVGWIAVAWTAAAGVT